MPRPSARPDGSDRLATEATDSGAHLRARGIGDAFILAHRGKDLPLALAAGIIQEQAARVRELMADLLSLGRSDGRYPGRVDLSALVTGVVTDLVRPSSREPHIVLGPLVERVIVNSDARVVAWSLRSLVFALLSSDPAPRGLQVQLAACEGEAILGIHVHFEGAEPSDIESGLSIAFGSLPTNRQCRRALCVHLLAAQGAGDSFQRLAQNEHLVRISLAIASRPRTRTPGPSRRRKDHHIPLEPHRMGGVS